VYVTFIASISGCGGLLSRIYAIIPLEAPNLYRVKDTGLETTYPPGFLNTLPE
jgi:hypothetical protein